MDPPVGEALSQAKSLCYSLMTLLKVKPFFMFIPLTSWIGTEASE